MHTFKPCISCHTRNRIIGQHDSEKHLVSLKCGNCGFQGIDFPSLKEAREDWNKTYLKFNK